MNTKLAIVALCVVASVVAGIQVQAPKATDKEVIWESLYSPPYIMEVEIAINLQCVAPNLCFIPGGANGAGFGMYKMNGQQNAPLLKMTEPNMTMMIMTSAMGGSAVAPKGAFGGVGLLSISKGVQYLKNSTEWLPSTFNAEEFIITTQSMRATDNGEHIIALNDGASNQMFHSTNAGVSFDVIKLTLPKPNNCTAPGYIAMVDEKTWYMTMGSAPENRAPPGPPTGNPPKYRLIKSVTQRTKIVQDMVTKKIHPHFVNPFDKEEQNLDNYVCVGFSALIVKTTDAGQTWETVFDAGADVQYTFNQIDCISATNCVAVADGMPSKVDPNVMPSARIFQTTDGKTWNEVLNVPGTSEKVFFLAAVRYASATEVWAAGAVQSRESSAGLFYHSKDGGKTWTQYAHSVPDMMQIMDLSFTGGVGFAVAMSMFKTANVIKYADQPFYGYFTQSNCPFKGCSILCRNATFPQGECLNTQGGSAKAFCTPNGLEQHIYETTSCVDSYKTFVQPINQCLNGTNGFFENYCDSNTMESSIHAHGTEFRV